MRAMIEPMATSQSRSTRSRLQRLAFVSFAALGCACGNSGTPSPKAAPTPASDDATTLDTNMPKPPPPTPAGGNSDLTSLARRLIELGYRALFVAPDRSQLDALWSGAAGELDALARDPGQDHQARFLAAELLFSKQPGFPPADLRPVLAPLYAEALGQTGNLTGRWQLQGNQWGLLHDAGPGPVGTHLLALGADAVAALRPLLDKDERVLYEGSRDATTGNMRRYRIKDIAAYYISRITGRPLAFHADPIERDRAINELKAGLP